MKAGKALFEEGSGIDFSNPAKRKDASTAAIEKFHRALDNATPNHAEKSAFLPI